MKRVLLLSLVTALIASAPLPALAEDACLCSQEIVPCDDSMMPIGMTPGTCCFYAKALACARMKIGELENKLQSCVELGSGVAADCCTVPVKGKKGKKKKHEKK